MQYRNLCKCFQKSREMLEIIQRLKSMPIFICSGVSLSKIHKVATILAFDRQPSLTLIHSHQLNFEFVQILPVDELFSFYGNQSCSGEVFPLQFHSISSALLASLTKFMLKSRFTFKNLSVKGQLTRQLQKYPIRHPCFYCNVTD